MAVRLHPAVLARFRFADALARNFRVPYTVTSTTRTTSQQARLYQAWLDRGKTGLPAAPPGTSTHEYGLAVDVVPKDPRDLPILVEILKCAGFVWATERDRVHFDVFGREAWRRILLRLPGARAAPLGGPGC